MAELDNLYIKIQTDADGTVKSLDKIIGKLDAVEESLGDAGNASTSGFSKMTTAATKLNDKLTLASAGMKNMRLSASSLTASFTNAYVAVRSLANAFEFLEDSVKLAMDAIETSNFFNVALDQVGAEYASQFERFGYESASAYVDSFADRLNELNKKLTGYTVGSAGELLLGDSVGLALDVELMQRFQAKTLSVTNAIGLLGETSINTTKALSMLVGDIASLTNADIETVMTNFSSGLIGQSRSLYKYGLDITNNTLQQYALAEGIQKSLSEMTQAEKMQLRLLAILDQSRVAYSDLANTLNSVANQSRITGQQLDNFSRTLGNLFLPVVKNVLPYINGMIIALNNLFTSLGFSLYGETWLSDLQDGITGGVTEGVEDLEGSLDDATNTANKLKKSLASFDELQVLNTGNIATGSLAGASEIIDLTDSISNALTNYEKQWEQAFAMAENRAADFAEELEEGLAGVADMAERIAPAIVGIGTAFASYKVAGGFASLIASLTKLASPIGVAALAAGAIGGVAYAISDMNKELQKSDASERFGNISLGLSDIESVAKKILNNKSLEKVSQLLSELEKTSGIESEIKRTVSELDRYNWQVSVGLTLDETKGEDYKQTISDYVSAVNDFVTQQHYSASLGIRLFLSNSETSADVQGVIDTFYNQQSGKLAELGEKLNEVTTNAWNDGLLTIDEVQTITNIQQQMANVQEQLATSEFKARMQLLEMDFSGANLTPETYKQLTEKRNELFEEYESELNESLVFTLSQVNLAYEAKLDAASTERAKLEIQRQWDAAIKEIQLNRDSQVEQMAMNALSFDFNTIAKTYGKEINSVYAGMIQELNELSGKLASGQSLVGADIQQYMNAITKQLKKEAGKGGAANFNEIVANMLDTEELESIAESYYKEAGEIPEGVAEALVSKYALDSISGNIASMYKLMLVSADSKDKEPVLEYMHDFGINVPGFMADGIKENTVSATDSLTNLLSTIEISLTDSAAPKAAYDLGKSISNSFANGLGGSLGLRFDKISFDGIGIKGYYTGGFPEDGLFMANHSELVGKFSNGKTAVANNQQITDGIEEAAYRGMMRAMSETSTDSNVTVVLEGDASGLFRVVRKSANEYFRVNGKAAFDF